MNVLVSAATKHGATAEIADHIGATLRDQGLAVAVAAPADEIDIHEFDAFVLGSAVYAGHWRQEAKDLARRVAEVSPGAPIWLFSSGPLGAPLEPEDAPVDVADLVEALSPREHRVFAGKVDKSNLGFGERAVMIAVHAPDGDFRNWDDITRWAEGIATSLKA